MVELGDDFINAHDVVYDDRLGFLGEAEDEAAAADEREVVFKDVADLLGVLHAHGRVALPFVEDAADEDDFVAFDLHIMEAAIDDAAEHEERPDDEDGKVELGVGDGGEAFDEGEEAAQERVVDIHDEHGEGDDDRGEESEERPGEDDVGAEDDERVGERGEEDEGDDLFGLELCGHIRGFHGDLHVLGGDGGGFPVHGLRNGLLRRGDSLKRAVHAPHHAADAADQRGDGHRI